MERMERTKTQPALDIGLKNCDIKKYFETIFYSLGNCKLTSTLDWKIDERWLNLVSFDTIHFTYI